MKEKKKALRLQRRIRAWESHQGKSAGGHYGKCPGSRKQKG